MKTLQEMRDEQGRLVEERNSILNTIQAEQRKATDDENKRLAEIAHKRAVLESDIQLAEERNKVQQRGRKKKGGGCGMLLRCIRDMVSGRYSDETEAIRSAGHDMMMRSGIASSEGLVIPMEYRGDNIQITGKNDGNEILSEDVMDILTPLRDKLVLVEAGANFLTGLVGNIALPSYSGSNASWEAETAAAKNGKGTFAKKQLSPKRLTSYIDISKQFLAQDSVGANAMLMNDLTTAVAVKLQSTILGKHDHLDTMPDGFFTGEVTYAMKGQATYKGIVDMESAVDLDSAMINNVSYIMHKGARGVLKTTLRAPSVSEGFIFEDGMVNGYKTFVTGGVASGLQSTTDEYGVIFGNWADLVIGQWGGLELTVDPYTQAGNGMVRLVINSYFDAKVRRDESFAIGSLK